MNDKKFDGEQLSNNEKELRDFYKRLLNFTIHSSALMGSYKEIHNYNRTNSSNYNHRVFSFVRWNDNEKLIIISNFDTKESYEFDLIIPDTVINTWKLKKGNHLFNEQLYGKTSTTLKVANDRSLMKIKIAPLESLVLKLQNY